MKSILNQGQCRALDVYGGELCSFVWYCLEIAEA